MSIRGKVRSRFTNSEVYEAVRLSKREDGSVDYRYMSEHLSDNEHGTVVTPELCRYWAMQFDIKKKNGEPYETLAKANKSIKDSRKLRSPVISDFDKLVGEVLPEESKPQCILVIPDQHSPYAHPDAIEFLIAVAAKYQPDLVVNLGDETDFHALSYHDSDPNLDSAGVELEKAREWLAKLESVFPEMYICHSNHGSMLHRKAKTHGIPADMIKSYREVLFPNGGGEGWHWDFEHKWNTDAGKVLFRHQASGSLISAASHEGCNLVIGHLHGKYGIEYAASSERLYWAMNGGCLIDAKSLAFAYGENFKHKPIIGCSVIIKGLPYLVPMQLDDNGRWKGNL